MLSGNCFIVKTETNYIKYFSHYLEKNIYILMISVRPSLKNCLFAVPLPCIFWSGR